MAFTLGTSQDNSPGFESIHQEQWIRYSRLVVTLLFAWAAIYCVSMNWQMKSGLRFAALTKELAALALLLVIAFPPKKLHFSRSCLIAVAGLFFAGWFWGLNDPFYMDGVQTSGRSQAFMLGEPITRFSLSYAILGPAFHWIGNWNWIGHLYVMLTGIILLYCISAFFNKPQHRLLILLMAFFSPHLFVLSKWLYLDIPMTAGMIASVLIFHKAVHKNSTPLYWLGVVLVTVTALLKEVGLLVMAPLLVLAITAPRPKRLKTAAYVLLSGALGFFAFWMLYRLYRGAHEWKGEHVAWLLFNADMVPLQKGFQWFGVALLANLRILTWWAFLIICLLGFVRPKNRLGYFFISSILLCNIVSLLAISSFQLSGRFRNDPLGEPEGQLIASIMLFAAISLIVVGLILRSLAFRKLKRLDWLCWTGIVAFLFVFSASGRLKFQGGAVNGILLDWRYLAPAVPFALILATRSAIRLLSPRHPLYVRLLIAFSLALGLEFCVLRSVTIASRTSEKARLNGKAYEVVRKQPERVIYTHWPFFMQKQLHVDYGTFRWKSDAFKVRYIWALRRSPKGKAPGALSYATLGLQSPEEYQGVDAWKLFPEKIFDKKAKIYYLRPFRLKLYKDQYHRVYLGRKAAKPQTPRHPLP